MSTAVLGRREAAVSKLVRREGKFATSKQTQNFGRQSSRQLV
jgi:hypothetical protein